MSARDSTPDTTQGAPEDAANKYMMSLFTQYILPKKLPDLSLIWFRTPDNVEHGYGPGTPNAVAGLRSQDARLGELLAALKANGMDGSTNVVVVSDHGHSTVSGPHSVPIRCCAITASATRQPQARMVNGATSGTSAASVGAVAYRPPRLFASPGRRAPSADLSVHLIGGFKGLRRRRLCHLGDVPG